MEIKERKYSKKHIGSEFISNNEYTFKVIDGGTKKNYALCILIDEPKFQPTELNISSLKKGEVKNPYERIICNVGYIGQGRSANKNKKETVEYATWRAMIKRAYDRKTHERQPTYKDVTVCDEWHNYQVFAEWFDENYIDGYELDKDLLGNGDKIYSPNTCCFIPARVNSFISNKLSTNTSGHIGAVLHKRDNIWESQIRVYNEEENKSERKYLGRFSTAEEASEAYKSARMTESDKLRNWCRTNTILSDRVIEAIK